MACKPYSNRPKQMIGFVAAIVLVTLGVGASSLTVQAQTDAKASVDNDHNQPPFTIRSATNLVVVRAAVRDAHGNPVENLQKADFRLFDNGKEQSIAQFEMKAPASETAPNQPTVPTHFVALFFDDVDTPLSYLTSGRDAADQFLKTYLRPSDRAALITTSGAGSVDFTSDLKPLHEALFKISPNEHGGDPRMQSWRNLQTLDQLVMRIAQMPGQRSIILVSPGFMSASQQAHVDAIIDRALRSQVVISTLDPRGLVPPPVADIMNMAPETAPPTARLSQPQETPGRATAPSLTPPSADFVDTLDPDLLIRPETVLQEVADGTGGEYFHDDNDLKSGFHRLSGTVEAYYILAFHPTDLKPDGRFHVLKVSLTERHGGFHLQARRGYFAPKSFTGPADEEEDEIREALLSGMELQQLPVALGAGLSEANSDTRELSLLAHLDARPLHFHKEGERNVNTVTFVFGIFDQNGAMVGLQRRRAKVNVLDAQFPDLFKGGVDVRMTFQLKPGVYRIREVVTDSEEHHMTTFTKNVKIP